MTTGLCKDPINFYFFFLKQHCECATADMEEKKGFNVLMKVLLAKLFWSLGEAGILVLLVLCDFSQRNRTI